MKNKIFRKAPLAALTMLLVLTMTVLPVFAAVSVPKYKEYYIADDAGLLSESTVHNIAKNNEKLFAKNGTSIGICTVKNIGDEAIADFARRVYESWNMVEGVLIVVAGEESADPRTNNYYLLQSTGVEDTVSNDVLENIRSEYMETDFAAGNIDRAVYSAATKLTTMLSDISDPDAPAAAPEDDTAQEEEPEGTTAGGVIVGILKFILIAALILIALFILFFIAAMFNDDAAELMRKYVFQRGKSGGVSSDFYDERLYGTNDRIQQRGRQNAQRAQQNPHRQQRPQNYQNHSRQGYPQNVNPGYNTGYRQNYPQNTAAPRQYGSQSALPPASVRSAQNPRMQQYNTPARQMPQQRPVMYNADGTVRRPAQNRPQNTDPNHAQARRAPQQNYQPADDGATRMFSLPHDSNH